MQNFQSIWRNKRGDILPLAAIGMVLTCTVIGGAVDFGRYYRMQNMLQAACDAGVLAGRRAVGTDGYDEDAQSSASRFFKVNFQVDGDSTFTTSSEDDGNNVEGVATYTLETLVMRLFGFDEFDLTANCSASMGVGNADVMMVLDTTGSMGYTLSGSSQTRISALRSAMKNFYTTLSGATTGSNARVRYGFVPYSSTVNVGHLLYDLDPSYIADEWTYQSREPYFIDYSGATASGSNTSYTSAGSSTEDYGNSSYSSEETCEANLPSDSDWEDYGNPSQSTSTTENGNSVTVTVTTSQTQRQMTYECVSQRGNGGRGRGRGNSSSTYKIEVTTTYRTASTAEDYDADYTNAPTSNSVFDHWEYKPVTYDTSAFKTFASTTSYTGTDGASVSSTWDGCIEERHTINAASFSYSSVTGVSPQKSYDIDIDMAPDSDEDTQWGPMWYQVAYTRAGTSTTNTNQFQFSNSETGSTNHVTEYCPKASQELQEMTQSSFDAYADSLTAVGGTYLDAGMIWGGRLLSPDGIYSDLVNQQPANGGEVSRHVVFMTDGQMDTSAYVHSAWGIEWFDRRVTGSGTSESQADDRHTSRFLAVCDAIKSKGIRIWVVAFTADLSEDLTDCASDDSSFTANSSSELNDAFQEIAKEVGELRITQ